MNPRALATLVEASGTESGGGAEHACTCSAAAPFLPYGTSGCLRCPQQDAAFYIQNVLAKILDQYPGRGAAA